MDIKDRVGHDRLQRLIHDVNSIQFPTAIQIGRKNDPLTVWRPSRKLLMRVRQVPEYSLVGAIGPQDLEVVLAVLIGNVRNLVPIWGIGRLALLRWMVGQSSEFGPIRFDVPDVHIARPIRTECNSLTVR